jgi:hypothetical protein
VGRSEAKFVVDGELKYSSTPVIAGFDDGMNLVVTTSTDTSNNSLNTANDLDNSAILNANFCKIIEDSIKNNHLLNPGEKFQSEIKIQDNIVKSLINSLIDKDCLNVSESRRSMRELLKTIGNRGFKDLVVKPSAGDPKSMYIANPKIFNCGNERLINSIVSPIMFAKYHKSSCLLCGKVEGTTDLDPNCYGSGLLQPLIYGWEPLVEEDKLLRNKVVSNYPNFSLFPTAVKKELDKMLSTGLLVTAASVKLDDNDIIFSPMNAIVKNSDKVKTKVLTGIDIIDEDSLNSANAALKLLNIPPVKARITNDLSRSNVNELTVIKPGFSYSSLHDFMAIVYKDCYMCKTDIARFFPNFKLSTNSYHLFGVKLNGVSYVATSCVFGYTLCPYFCSAYAGEIARWFRYFHKLPLANYMDDFMTVGENRRKARRNLAKLEKTITSVGLSIALDKSEMGQALLILGFWFSSVTMTLRVDHLQAVNMCIMLKNLLKLIVKGKQFERAMVHHLCGKMNFYAEVLQAGRARLRSFWCYLKYGLRLSKDLKKELIQDANWWISLFEEWSKSKDHPITFQIDKTSRGDIVVFNSDASGTDGFGYRYGKLNDDLIFWCSPWFDDYQPLGSSGVAELQAPLHYIRNCNLRNTMVIWLTDNLNNAYSINKGRAINPQPNFIIKLIFDLCDQKAITFLAFWIPREINTITDFLSHFATIRNKRFIVGYTSELI